MHGDGRYQQQLKAVAQVALGASLATAELSAVVYSVFRLPLDSPIAVALKEAKAEYQRQLPGRGQAHPLGGERVVTGPAVLRLVLEGLKESPAARERVLNRYPEAKSLMTDPSAMLDHWEQETRGVDGPFGFLTAKERPAGMILTKGPAPGRLGPPEWPCGVERSAVVGILATALHLFRLKDKRPRTEAERIVQAGIRRLLDGEADAAPAPAAASQTADGGAALVGPAGTDRDDGGHPSDHSAPAGATTPPPQRGTPTPVAAESEGTVGASCVLMDAGAGLTCQVSPGPDHSLPRTSPETAAAASSP